MKKHKPILIFVTILLINVTLKAQNYYDAINFSTDKQNYFNDSIFGYHRNSTFIDFQNLIINKNKSIKTIEVFSKEIFPIIDSSRNKSNKSKVKKSKIFYSIDGKINLIVNEFDSLIYKYEFNSYNEISINYFNEKKNTKINSPFERKFTTSNFNDFEFDYDGFINYYNLIYKNNKQLEDKNIDLKKIYIVPSDVRPTDTIYQYKEHTLIRHYRNKNKNEPVLSENQDIYFNPATKLKVAIISKRYNKLVKEFFSYDSNNLLVSILTIYSSGYKLLDEDIEATNHDFCKSTTFKIKYNNNGLPKRIIEFSESRQIKYHPNKIKISDFSVSRNVSQTKYKFKYTYY